MGASMPSAGVACASERQILERLVNPATGGPFDPESLTEDYEVGLRIGNMGGRGIFVRMRDRDGQLVATKEYRSEERSVGKECVSTGRSRGSQDHFKKKTKHS